MKRLLTMDRLLVGLTFAVIAIGITMLYTAVSSGSSSGAGFLLRRLVQLLLGLGLLTGAALFDRRTLNRIAPMIWILSIVLLLGVLFTSSIRGTRGWLSVFGFSIQPVDIARVALLLLMAKLLAQHRKSQNLWRRFLPALIVTGLTAFLVALQPDFGSALALALSGGLLLIAARLPWRWILVLGAAAVLLFVGAYNLSDRVHKRVNLTYRVDPTAIEDDTYQLSQSLIALGAGGMFGQGAGDSRQKTHFLPDHHTDFIYSIIGEEFGLAGTLGVLIVMALLIMRILWLAARAPDPFGRYLATGVALMLFVYTALNISVATGLFPLTGVPLPFISHGGSALVMNLLAVGLVLNVTGSRQGRTPIARGEWEDPFGRSRL